MEQKRIRTVNGLIDAGEKASGGADEFGAILELVYGSKTNIDGDVSALITARDNHEAAKTTLRTLRGTLGSVTGSLITFATLARNTLEPILGNRYSQAWDAVGFRNNSLSIPQSHAGAKELVRSMKAYFTSNPTLEVASLNLTAARAGNLVESAGEAQIEVNVQEAAVKTLLEIRYGKEDAVAFRLAGTVQELSRKLNPLDPRYKAFGFNMPGAQETPDMPLNVIAVLIGPNAVAVKWDAAPRAEHYRVWKKVVGVDEDFIAVDSRADLDVTIEGLPANATIEIAISAVNNGGESAKSEVVKVTMG